MNRKTLSAPVWLGLFTGLSLLCYLLAATLFLPVQSLLPAGGSLNLAFYRPYVLTEPLVLLGHALRFLLMGALLLFLRPAIPEKQRGSRTVFGLLWGLALLLSLEPQPGSVEGMIYLQATVWEHGLVLLYTGGQTVLLITLLRRITGGLLPRKETPAAATTPLPERGTWIRWTLIYVAVYWVVGSVFYNLSGYQEALATMEELSMFRPLENIPAVLAVFLGQFVRGPLLLLFLWPLRSLWLIPGRRGMVLFVLLLGFTVLGGYGVLPAMTSGLGQMSPADYLAGLAIGIPELLAQSLLFSWLFVRLETRRRARAERNAPSEVSPCA